jgi:acetoin utilization deacetylase AcuC-like enzyme
MPKLYYVETAAGAAEAPKCRWLVEALANSPSPASRRVKVEKLSQAGGGDRSWPRSLLSGVHGTQYIDEVWQDGAGGGVRLAPSDRYAESFGQLRALSEAAVVAGQAVFPGSSSRVTGSLGGSVHHARRSSACGGMSFNSLAVVASAMTSPVAFQNGLTPFDVLILDADGDCGGGTAELIAGDVRVRQVDIAVSSRDAYENTENATLHLVSHATDYLPTIRHVLEGVVVGHGRECLCLYTAGVDGHEAAVGGMSGITADVLAERDRIVFDWCLANGVRVAYTIGGGDVSDRLSVELLITMHRQTIETAAMAASRKRLD